MPEITLPDGSRRSYDEPPSVADVAADIGPGLARAALAGRVGGQLVDTDFRIENDADVAIVTARDADGLEVLRHSTAHLLAQAVQELFPGAQVTIGPVIEDGFYYDFSYERGFTPEDLERIEKRMKELAKADLPVSRETLARDDAVEFFKSIGEHYKAEIIAGIPEDEAITLYGQGEWKDLCRGPHVPSTGHLKAFKLTRTAGAYWRGDSSNEQLRRIYGTAWADSKSLKVYLRRLEEAAKRDHRRIGTALDLFSIQEDAGGGLVFWHPKGARIRRVIEDFWRERHEQAGYELLYTPHIALEDLWDRSGHTDFYRESMYSPVEEEGRGYQLRPMNCPFHILIYRNRLRSHRELPMRWAELGTVYRREMSGALHGLMRVRGFTQDDAHIFCTEEQIADEILRILDLALELFGAFGFEELNVVLATRPEKAVGTPEIWDRATAALESALDGKGMSYEVDPGGGAFYGPKIDIKIRDAIGREWQCSTVQLDFNLPERFELEYVAADGARRRPIMIHRALLGSLERFFGILIEHYAGKFPFWLAPVQTAVLAITERQEAYARQVLNALQDAGLRADADLRSETIGYKIRDHTLQGVPYLLVIGDREAREGTVAVRSREDGDLGAMSLDDFMARTTA
ncbi:MAG: threonine--tRNA ligase [Gammaproteobacteria bacterium]|nr:threonine--tRNA ligase [Gammaproteobacteria bacterium]MXW46174.1 threonine--tRNA ligase [Gammaproteobacteria bacterium]MYD01720.1 threonine--tRNA ligase [Gammaproteobacteria bacterium]MYI26429.1 threonine--tRNA ligase [Gammaproteobacteria bacterium]